MTAERLQKIMAHAGIASRRASEELIKQGRVSVNGQVVTELGVKVDPAKDVIVVDGRRLPRQAAEKLIYAILNKPRYVLSDTGDSHGRKTVLDLVDFKERVYPVGRLDFKSEGLILLTNDGELAARLTHPRHHIEKEYHVLVAGSPSNETLNRWQRGGIEIEEGRTTGPAVVERLNKEGEDTWLKIILTEGRKRQIRKVATTLGHPAIRLERVRIGPLKLGNLKPGHWRHLNQAEIQRLKAEAGL